MTVVGNRVLSFVHPSSPSWDGFVAAAEEVNAAASPPMPIDIRFADPVGRGSTITVTGSEAVAAMSAVGLGQVIGAAASDPDALRSLAYVPAGIVIAAPSIADGSTLKVSGNAVASLQQKEQANTLGASPAVLSGIRVMVSEISNATVEVLNSSIVFGLSPVDDGSGATAPVNAELSAFIVLRNGAGIAGGADATVAGSVLGAGGAASTLSFAGSVLTVAHNHFETNTNVSIVHHTSIASLRGIRSNSNQQKGLLRPRLFTVGDAATSLSDEAVGFLNTNITALIGGAYGDSASTEEEAARLFGGPQSRVPIVLSSNIVPFEYPSHAGASSCDAVCIAERSPLSVDVSCNYAYRSALTDAAYNEGNSSSSVQWGIGNRPAAFAGIAVTAFANEQCPVYEASFGDDEDEPTTPGEGGCSSTTDADPTSAPNDTAVVPPPRIVLVTKHINGSAALIEGGTTVVLPCCLPQWMNHSHQQQRQPHPLQYQPIPPDRNGYGT